MARRFELAMRHLVWNIRSGPQISRYAKRTYSLFVGLYGVLAHKSLDGISLKLPKVVLDGDVCAVVPSRGLATGRKPASTPS